MKSIVILAIASLVKAQFKCPKENGQYADKVQCDKYWDCSNGVATQNLCPDGLVYDSSNTRSINKCKYPFEVECNDRTSLQSPQSSTNCARRNGLFAHVNETVCDIYYDCIDGVANEIKCSNGIGLDEEPALCKWSYLLAKETCKTASYSFVCPKLIQGNHKNVYPAYPHLSDCQKFYVCFNGYKPRELNCPFGEVFNDGKQKCDDPTNVPGCEDWYTKIEEFEDTTEDVQIE